MKAVAADAGLAPFFRQGVVAEQVAMARMEGGVETADLHRIREEGSQPAHGGKGVRLVQIITARLALG